MRTKNQIPVAILGATGLVGQKAISLIDKHPKFYVSEVAASEKNTGKTYSEATLWRFGRNVPESVANLHIKRIAEVESRYVISALPASVAANCEKKLAERGSFVFTNASYHRLDENVPLLIPEINLEHLSLLERQTTTGKIVSNSNCTAAFINLALAPLMRIGTVDHVSIVTMQAISGAGYPSCDSLDIMGNIIPYIPDEEEKIAKETHKILGCVNKPATFGITTNVHRVPVLHGHTAVMHVHFKEDISLDAVRESYLKKNRTWPSLYKLYDQNLRPQPALDIGDDDMGVHIGRIKHGAKNNILSLIVMGNNLVRGAAGAAICNMEATLHFLGVVRL